MKVSQNTSAKECRALRDAEVVVTAAYTTTASFADVPSSIVDCANYQTVAIILKNTGGVNGASWTINASIDGTTYVEIVSSANVAFGAVGTPYTVSPAPYRYYKVQTKDQVGASHTTVVVSIIAK